jgi:hypothetical protein
MRFVREALVGTDQANLAEQQARKLKEGNPKLHLLTSALRRQGFVQKAGQGSSPEEPDTRQGRLLRADRR